MGKLKDRVKDAAHGRWVDILSDLGGISPHIFDGKHHPCPRCDGTDRFRVINLEQGALYCNQCFNEKNGDGLAALGWLTGWDFKTALNTVADWLGISHNDRLTPESVLDWLPWNDQLVGLWLLQKPGITMEALTANAARLATWHRFFTVIALPIQAPGKSKPVGWLIWNLSGRPLKKADGQEAKVLCTVKSKAGWIGAAGLEALQAGTAKVVWKVEGPSDMLALWSAIPSDARSGHVVISNAFGAGEKPRDKLIEVFRGLTACVCHDIDKAGQAGAERWVSGISRVAAETRAVKLPGPETDLREWLVAGHTYEQLREIARAADPIPGPSSLPARDSGAGGSGVDSGAGGGRQDPDEPAREEADTDPIRLARLFIQSRGGRIAYWREDFYCWRDRRWQEISRSNIKSYVYNFIGDELRRIYDEDQEVSKQKEEITKVIKISDTLLRGVLTAIGAATCIASAIEWGMELERPGNLSIVESGKKQRWIALENGILDLPKALQNTPDALQPHTYDWWSPCKLPYDYDPNAGLNRCPLWRAFLDRNLEADQGRIAVLQEWAGYCLVPDAAQQRFLILEGEGANGKSVYCAVLEALLGPENVSHVALELWGQRFQLTPTLGKLANIITEVGELDRIAEGILKAYTDGSGMTFDRKGRDQIEARPTARLLIATNNRPRFSDRSTGLWRRMIIVPWNVEIPEGDRTIGMDHPDYWLESGEMPAIFNWAVRGLYRLYHQKKFSIPPVVEETKEDYRRDTNPARDFLLDNYSAVDSQFFVNFADLYREYSKHCEDNGYRPLASRGFGREIKRVFSSAKRIQRGPRGHRSWVYQGVARQS